MIAWQLRRALQKEGHEVLFVQDHNPAPKLCDHTIVISNVAMKKILEDKDYEKLLRAATLDKLCLWLDSDLGNWKPFDYVLCVNKCHKRDGDQFHYVGWATNPLLFYPRQTRRAIFIDPYMEGWYGRKHDHVYRSIQKVLEYVPYVKFQPVRQYNKGRVSWLAMANFLSQSSYFIATQLTNWGLVNLEAAMCGALLILHEELDIPETWPSKLNYVTWSTEEELTQILKKPVNIRANRELAMQTSWSKVVKRIMEVLA